MKNAWKVLLLLVPLTALPALAQEDAAVGVKDAVIAREVENREPVGASTSFAEDVGELACFTRIVGGEGTTIQHVWFRGDEEMARVNLPVGSPSWRTWSTKRILPSWTGDWKVEIQDADGNVIDTVSFHIGPAAAAQG